MYIYIMYIYIPCINLTASISQDFHFQVQCQFLIRFFGVPHFDPTNDSDVSPYQCCGPRCPEKKAPHFHFLSANSNKD